MKDILFSFIEGYMKVQIQTWYFSMVNITRGWTHVRDAMFSKFHNRKILQNRESFGKWCHNLLVTSDVHDGE